jgi:type II secretory ATPase GspE/PulE/Tfp pilus assembly ATPase PilB-like protein
MVTVVNQKPFRITCGKCKSELEYLYSEVQKYKTNQDYLGDYDTVNGIKCPMCQTVLTHKQ